ncbi:MAG TPA: hypothetical protein VHS53_00160 [Mucilaginibacter sp.]|jgi:hypothetical protein|nr:hypothetical protein [Mucilaginibacter sp.]HWD89575.1 hypothetical protein [Mucilaginibacter sp.]
MAHLEVKPRSRNNAWLWIIIILIIAVIAFIAWRNYGAGKMVFNNHSDTTKTK